MLITTNIHIPVAANLPALNLRLVRATEDPKERLEIAEASVKALTEVPKYEEVAKFTEEALTGVTGRARRQAMITAALSAMAACPNMICVGHALIGNAPREEQVSIANKVLTRLESNSGAPELKIARRLLEDPELTSAEKAEIVMSAIDGAGRDASLLEATSDIISVPFKKATNRRHAAQVAIDAILPLVPAYSREVLELALDLLQSNPQPKSALAVTQELFSAANEDPGRELSQALYAASLKCQGESKKALLSQGLEFLGSWSTVPGMEPAVSLVSRVAGAAGEASRRVQQASLQALAELSYQDTPILAVARRIVMLARYPHPQGGIGETQSCEPALVAVLEGMKPHVHNPEVLTEAIVKLQNATPSTELPLGRSSRQAAIANRALSAANPV